MSRFTRAMPRTTHGYADKSIGTVKGRGGWSSYLWQNVSYNLSSCFGSPISGVRRFRSFSPMVSDQISGGISSALEVISLATFALPLPVSEPLRPRCVIVSRIEKFEGRFDFALNHRS